MLMNTAQHVAMTKLRSSKIVEDTDVPTFINCIPDLCPIYAQYGFKRVDVKEIQKTRNKYQCVYSHFDENDWYDKNIPLEEQSMSIMIMEKSVARWTNVLKYELSSVEMSLYDGSFKDPKQSSSSR